MFSLAYRGTRFVCCKSYQRALYKVRHIIRRRAFHEDEDPYKASDDIVYTDKYWSIVKRLDDSWNASTSAAKVIPDGKYLSDMIERKWKRKYKCQFSQDHRGNIIIQILPSIAIDDDEEYYKQMDKIVSVLHEYGATQKVYDEITFHINTKGPERLDWVLRERHINIPTGICINGLRNREWKL